MILFSSAQSSLVKVYNAQAFSCGKGGTTIETNLCSGEKVAFDQTNIFKKHEKRYKKD
jgi:hypothetical protein